MTGWSSPRFSNLCTFVHAYGLNLYMNYKPIWLSNLERAMPLYNHRCYWGDHKESPQLGHHIQWKWHLKWGITSRRSSVEQLFAMYHISTYLFSQIYWQKEKGENVDLDLLEFIYQIKRGHTFVPTLIVDTFRALNIVKPDLEYCVALLQIWFLEHIVLCRSND